MYENDYMYAIERSSDYLAHYGIRGMKWGVRKAIESGNAKRLSRQYAKAQKKLAKLEKRANSGAKYARRAAALGAGAAAAGGLAAAGTSGVGRILRKSGGVVSGGARALGSGISGAGKLVGTAANVIPGKQVGLARLAGSMNAAGRRMSANAGMAGQGLRRAGTAVTAWGGKNTLAKAAAGKYARLAAGKGAVYNTAARDKAMSKIGGITNNTIARIGAGAVGAGLAAGAGYNAYRAATTKRAARKAAEFRNEMNKAFKGTQYANGGGNRQGKKRRRR